MNKFVWLRILNVLLLLSALFQAGTGVLGWAKGIDVDGSFFIIAHPYNGVFLVALILVHLALNRQWIAQNYFRRAPRPAAAQPAHPAAQARAVVK